MCTLIAGKGAKNNMEEKNKLLSELQQKLIPLEKETADNLLGTLKPTLFHLLFFFLIICMFMVFTLTTV